MVATCTRRPLEVLHEVAQAPWSSGHECGVNPCGATSLTGAAALELQCRSPSGCSSMVELQLPKLLAWVRFPSPAPSHSCGRRHLLSRPVTRADQRHVRSRIRCPADCRSEEHTSELQSLMRI